MDGWILEEEGVGYSVRLEIVRNGFLESIFLGGFGSESKRYVVGSLWYSRTLAVVRRRHV